MHSVIPYIAHQLSQLPVVDSVILYGSDDSPECPNDANSV